MFNHHENSGENHCELYTEIIDFIIKKRKNCFCSLYLSLILSYLKHKGNLSKREKGENFYLKLVLELMKIFGVDDLDESSEKINEEIIREKIKF